MSAFTIYAIVLTGIYIIYYPVQIMLDLFGKKGQKKDGVEEFNTEDSPAEEEDSGIIISETADGYVEGIPNAADSEDSLKPEVPDVAPPLTPAEEEQLRDQTLYESLTQEQLNPVHVDYQEEYDADAFMVAMGQPLSSTTRIFKQIVSI